MLTKIKSQYRGDATDKQTKGQTDGQTAASLKAPFHCVRLRQELNNISVPCCADHGSRGMVLNYQKCTRSCVFYHHLLQSIQLVADWMIDSYPVRCWLNSSIMHILDHLNLMCFHIIFFSDSRCYQNSTALTISPHLQCCQSHYLLRCRIWLVLWFCVVW